MRKAGFRLFWFFLLALIFCAFSPILQNQYINFDDTQLILANPWIQRITLKNLEVLFLHPENDFYMPLVFFSFMIQKAVIGLSPASSHLVSVLIHAANAFLFYRLARLLGLDRLSSCAGMLLFALHPLRVESVAWASERKDLLYAFFFLCSFSLYLSYRQTSKRRFYLFSLLFFGFSLWSKPAAVTLPLLLAAYDIFLLKKFTRSSAVALSPFIFLSVYFIALTLFTQATLIPNLQHRFDPLHFTDLFSQAFLFYVSKIAAPSHLSFLYAFPYAASDLRFHSLAAFFFTAVLIFASFDKTKTAIVSFGLLFFFLTLLPMLQVAYVRMVVADRYTYLPAAGLTLALVSLIHERKNHMARRVILVVIMAISFIFFRQTYERAQVWRDDIRLWSDVIRTDARNERAYILRGVAYGEAHQYSNALKDFETIVKIEPSSCYNSIYDFEAYGEMAGIYAKQNDRPRALKFYAKALRETNRLIALRKLQYADSNIRKQLISDYLRINLSKASMLHNMGVVYRQSRQPVRAEHLFRQALYVHPLLASAFFQLASLHYEKGAFLQAQQEIRKSVYLNPNDSNARLLFLRIENSLSHPAIPPPIDSP